MQMYGMITHVHIVYIKVDYLHVSNTLFAATANLSSNMSSTIIMGQIPFLFLVVLRSLSFMYVYIVQMYMCRYSVFVQSRVSVSTGRPSQFTLSRLVDCSTVHTCTCTFMCTCVQEEERQTRRAERLRQERDRQQLREAEERERQMDKKAEDVPEAVSGKQEKSFFRQRISKITFDPSLYSRTCTCTCT